MATEPQVFTALQTALRNVNMTGLIRLHVSAFFDPVTIPTLVPPIDTINVYFPDVAICTTDRRLPVKLKDPLVKQLREHNWQVLPPEATVFSPEAVWFKEGAYLVLEHRLLRQVDIAGLVSHYVEQWGATAKPEDISELLSRCAERVLEARSAECDAVRIEMEELQTSFFGIARRYERLRLQISASASAAALITQQREAIANLIGTTYKWIRLVNDKVLARTLPFEIQSGGVRYPFGAFLVTIDPFSTAHPVRIQGTSPSMAVTYRDNEYYHPHVSSTNICWGNQLTEVARLAETADIFGLLLVTSLLLKSYSGVNPYVAIERFPRRDVQPSAQEVPAPIGTGTERVLNFSRPQQEAEGAGTPESNLVSPPQAAPVLP